MIKDLLDKRYTYQESTFIRYAGTKFQDENKVHPFCCCNNFKECNKAKHCIKLDEQNKLGKSSCIVFIGLCRGEIYMCEKHQKGMKKQAIKEVYSELENGVKVRYLIGKNIDNIPVYVIFVKYKEDYILFDSIVTSKKVNRTKLDSYVLKHITE